MRYLALGEVLELHRRLIQQSGGATGLRDLGLLQSALAQPAPHSTEQTCIRRSSTRRRLWDSRSSPIIPSWTGTSASEVCLVLNGFDIDATVHEQERIMLGVAAGEIDRETFKNWLRTKVRKVD
jgi:death-on-curing protein